MRTIRALSARLLVALGLRKSPPPQPHPISRKNLHDLILPGLRYREGKGQLRVDATTLARQIAYRLPESLRTDDRWKAWVQNQIDQACGPSTP